MTSTVDASVLALASTQFDHFSRGQVLELGGSDTLIARRVRSGQWLRVHPGVHRLPGLGHGWFGSLWAASLAIGACAVVSHESAAALHGLRSCAQGPVTFTIPHGAHVRVAGATVHQLRDHPTAAIEVDRSSGLVVTTVPRTLIDLAAVISRPRLAKIVEEAVLDRRVTWPALTEAFGATARFGKPGLMNFARVLDRHTSVEPLPQSMLERALFELLDGAHLPRPARQFTHPAGAALPGCVDAAYVPELLIIETDGRRWHTRIADLRRDHERDAAAAREGWQTLRFLHEHVVGDSAGVAETVAAVLEVRSRRSAA